MQIQQIPMTNFKATKVLNAERSLARGKKEIIDVFRLDERADKEFIQKCHDLLASSKERNLTAFQKRLKSILAGFLKEANALSEDYYIAIKNNEEIIGCMNSVPLIKDVIPLNIFASENKFQNTNNLFYALLKDSQKNYKGYNIKTKEIAKKLSLTEMRIRPENIDSYKKTIEESFNNIKFKSVNIKNINLDNIFGTECFETEKILNT